MNIKTKCNRIVILFLLFLSIAAAIIYFITLRIYRSDNTNTNYTINENTITYGIDSEGMEPNVPEEIESNVYARLSVNSTLIDGTERSVLFDLSVPNNYEIESDDDINGGKIEYLIKRIDEHEAHVFYPTETALNNIVGPRMEQVETWDTVNQKIGNYNWEIHKIKFSTGEEQWYALTETVGATFGVMTILPETEREAYRNTTEKMLASLKIESISEDAPLFNPAWECLVDESTENQIEYKQEVDRLNKIRFMYAQQDKSYAQFYEDNQDLIEEYRNTLSTLDSSDTYSYLSIEPEPSSIDRIYYNSYGEGRISAYTIGGTTFISGSDGYMATANQIGETSFFSDNRGNRISANEIGGTTFYSGNNGYRGSAYEIGDTTFYSDFDGNRATYSKIGDTLYFRDSNGRHGSCNNIGSSTYCRGY